MNKKFSTLVAALLLSGALFTVEAASKSPADVQGIEVSTKLIKLTENVDLEGDYLLVTTDNTVIDGAGYELKGRIVIKAEGCEVRNFKNLVLANKAGNATEQKTAIVVVAKSVTITNNTIECSADGEYLANGITIFPTAETVEYNVSDNIIIGANSAVDTWQSCGIQIVEGLAKAGLYEGNSAVLKDFDIASISNNTFTNCAGDYVWSTYENGSNKGYKAVRVTPMQESDGTFYNQTYINSLINNTVADAEVLFNGTVEQLQAAVEAAGENYFAAENAAVQCLGDADGNGKGNVLFGNAANPNNGQSAVVADVTAPAPAIDGYKLLEANNGDFNLLVMVAESKSYVIGWDHEADKVIVKGLNEGDLATYASNAEYLWKMTEGQDNTGEKLNYYIFTNQKGDVLEASFGAGTGTNDGKFYPANDFAKYNSGIVFNLYGTTLEKNTAHYFGLYEAGKNVLTVEDLNYFEQDGFSVTIKYQDADGKFTKEDIAGNEFVGHLTPMTWSGSEFKEAADNATSFYLKNADGEYIVVNAKDAGTSGNNVLYFSTLSEEALEHHLARVAAGDDQEYFGEFKALASASQADPKKLTVIDELQINVNGWLTLGRWDKDETPTLAAATSNIELQPIQIALGSDKIVKAKDLLKKGKFYTVEIVASTEEDDPMVGKKLVAGAADVDNETAWVESYGNVLEGQFALTYDAANKRYIFTNREQLDNAYWFAENSLYTTDEDNEYRWAGTDWTLKIDTVAGHKASDGYQTLEDVKNNKFYIGYASGIFGGNAWFVENHEGKENHVIGLNTNQEDALIFSAKEYAAARQLEKENKETHRYEYIPTDSIYVISTLGYFDGDEYKGNDYKDTLKIVSYTFVNQFTEPLIYNNGLENRLESDVMWNDPNDNSSEEVRYANVEDAHSQAQHFALRIDGTKLNLRKVELTKYAIDEANYTAKDDHVNLYQPMVGNWKLSAGDTDDKGIVTDAYYLNREENDLFVVEPTEKPMYRTVINPLDTISIFRDDNSQSVLFEHNTFLGMENLSQYPEIAKAMIADTAYVRNNTYRPQYMLVVGADITPAGKWCPIHGDDPTCPDAHKVETSGWVEGRYLVNLVDTAIAWDAANKHKDNNPYINSEKYYRLGFVQAKHINDSLVIASTNDTLYRSAT